MKFCKLICTVDKSMAAGGTINEVTAWAGSMPTSCRLVRGEPSGRGEPRRGG